MNSKIKKIFCFVFFFENNNCHTNDFDSDETKLEDEKAGTRQPDTVLEGIDSRVRQQTKQRKGKKFSLNSSSGEKSNHRAAEKEEDNLSSEADENSLCVSTRLGSGQRRKIKRRKFFFR